MKYYLEETGEDIMYQQNYIMQEQSNYTFVSGYIEDELVYSHDFLGETFYRTRIRSLRTSKREDFVPIVIPSSLIYNYLHKFFKGMYVEVVGQFRSHNKWSYEYCRNVLELFVYPKFINIYENKSVIEKSDHNIIFLTGYICKPTILRRTNSGMKITDLLIAVNRKNNKSDYIPCISWNKYAKLASNLKVGDKIVLYGRIQSRVFPIKDKGFKEVYEISIINMDKLTV